MADQRMVNANGSYILRAAVGLLPRPHGAAHDDKRIFLRRIHHHPGTHFTHSDRLTSTHHRRIFTDGSRTGHRTGADLRGYFDNFLHRPMDRRGRRRAAYDVLEVETPTSIFSRVPAPFDGQRACPLHFRQAQSVFQGSVNLRQRGGGRLIRTFLPRRDSVKSDHALTRTAWIVGQEYWRKPKVLIPSDFEPYLRENNAQGLHIRP